MALSANRELDHLVDQELRTYRVAGSATIYKNAIVGLKSDGYARGLIAGDPFIGIALDTADNDSGSDGAITIRVYTLGDFIHAISGATIASVGRPVFAGADDTLSFVGHAKSYVGIMQDLDSAGVAIVRIDPTRKLIKTITHAVEDLAANGDIPARAVHCFDQDAWIVAARVVNQASAATGVDDSNTSVHVLKIASATVVTKTYNSGMAFPNANTEDDLGTVANNHAAAGDAMTYEVLNGTTADLGPYLVEVDYV